MDKNRFLAQKVNRLLEMFPAVAIIAPGNAGKSTLVKAIRTGNIMTWNGRMITD
ncbi:MAG: hypothetical protein SCH71_08255 [Desulfobulbaceae bacterium]|nr:hypothetical protein [Desulfobulbaceae bacterium]